MKKVLVFAVVCCLGLAAGGEKTPAEKAADATEKAADAAKDAGDAATKAVDDATK